MQDLEAKHEELISIVETILKDEEEIRPLNYGKSSREEQLDLSSTWLQAFLNGQNKEEKVLAVEKSFEILLPGLAVPIVGRVDAVMEDKSGDIIIVDYKTASTRPSQGDIDTNLQMTLYGLWGKLNWPNRDIKLRMDYIIKSKRTPVFIPYETGRTDLHETELVQLFCKVYNHICMLRAEVIDPLPVTSWRCPTCSFRHACRGEQRKAVA